MEDRNFSNKLKVTKQFLINNPDIFFTNADKGNLTVCLKVVRSRKLDLRQKQIILLSRIAILLLKG